VENPLAQAFRSAPDGVSSVSSILYDMLLLFNFVFVYSDVVDVVVVVVLEDVAVIMDLKRRMDDCCEDDDVCCCC